MRKLFYVLLVCALGLCNTSCIYEEHTDYAIDWSFSVVSCNDLDEFSQLSNAFYDAFDAEFATVGEFVGGEHNRCLRDSDLDKASSIAAEHAKAAAAKLNFPEDIRNHYAAKVEVSSADREKQAVVWSQEYGM